jgi:hypothetical protein
MTRELQAGDYCAYRTQHDSYVFLVTARGDDWCNLDKVPPAKYTLPECIVLPSFAGEVWLKAED